MCVIWIYVTIADEGQAAVGAPVFMMMDVSPGIRPLFRNQNIAQKEPLKNIPSTHANATRRLANDPDESIHL